MYKINDVVDSQATEKYNQKISVNTSQQIFDSKVADSYHFDQETGQYVLENESELRNFEESDIGKYTCGYFISPCNPMYKINAVTEKLGVTNADVYYASLNINKITNADEYTSTLTSTLVTESGLYKAKDEDGDSPNLGQFQQQSMAPHLEHFKLYASAFAGETGLTLDDLGFPTNNPSSAEAIKAAHETLRCEAKRAQRTFGAGFLNAGFLAACLRDETNYERKAFYQTKPTWYPVFEADAGMLSSIGDGVIKINQVMPGYINDNNLRQLTGIKRSESNSDPTDIANDDWLEE